MGARAQLIQLRDVVRRLRTTRRDGAVELRHGFLGTTECQEQAAAQRGQRAIVVVVHAAGLAERQFGAVAPARRLSQRVALDLHIAHAHLRKARAHAIADTLVNAQAFGCGNHCLVEPAGGIENGGSAVERGGEPDLRLLLAEKRDGFIHQRQRLRIVAHAELCHRQAARSHHGFFEARIPPQQRVRAQQVVERLVGIAVAEIQPASIAKHAAERKPPVAHRIDDARELNRGGVDPANIRADHGAYGAHADGEVGHVTCRQQREPGVRVRDALPAEAELARGLRGDGMQRCAPRGRHVGRGRDGIGELRQGRGRVAECEFLDLGEVARLGADTGCIRLGQHKSRQRQQAADAQPYLPGVRADHGA